jgi:hypothetical protein
MVFSFLWKKSATDAADMPEQKTSATVPDVLKTNDQKCDYTSQC